VEVIAIDPTGVGRGLANLLGHFRHIEVFGQVIQDNSEFIAAKSKDMISFSQTGFEPKGHCFEQFIPHVMAQRVIDVLKLVQIQKEERPFAPVSSTVFTSGPALCLQQFVLQA
jgi:hypothetical protein